MPSEPRTSSLIVTVLVMLAIGGSGCGGFVESGGDVKRLTVGAEGGTLMTDGFTLVVPPHALGDIVTLSARREAIDAPAGPAFTIGPDHVTFDAGMPAEVVLRYDTSLHPHLPEIFVALRQGTVWHALAASSASVSGEVHATTTIVGTFGVIDCPGGTCPVSGADAGTD